MNLTKESDQSFLLKSGDEIVIYSDNNLFRSSNIEINGHINKPGKYEFKNGMTIQDLIYESGGFNNDATQKFVEVFSINNKGEKNKKIIGNYSEYKLNKEDIVYVRRDNKYFNQFGVIFI